MENTGDITSLLRRLSSGDSSAENELLPHVYAQLRRIASNHVYKESDANMLQATALVHEAYLRMGRDAGIDWQGRAHFFAVASRIMRRILIENARSRGCVKRGEGIRHVVLDESLVLGNDTDETVVAVHEALERLEILAPRQARIVEMRFFAGLKVEEISEVLELSVRTVHREWISARAWLYGELKGGA